MLIRSPALLLATLALAATLPAQVAAIVGPPVAPTGCPITVAISNDTTNPVGTGVCPFTVRDASNTTVYAPFCILILQIIQPGGTFETTWDQRDNSGAQVPPGNYFVDVILPGGAGMSSFPITIGGVPAAIAHMGVPRIGTTRNLRICSPQDAGAPYVMAAALNSVPGIPSCAGVIPLAPDPLFFFSLMPGNGVFLGFQGMLDGNGVATTPALAIPNAPALVGANVILDFVTVAQNATCPIQTIAAPLIVTVQ